MGFTYAQRMYDTGTSGWVYYAKEFIDVAPLAGETTPNYTGVISNHALVSIIHTERDLWPALTDAKTGAYTAKVGENVLYDPSGGTFQITAPASPALSQRWAVKNVTTDVTVITISGNGTNIQDPATNTVVASYTIGGAFVSLDFAFDGTNWVIL